MNDDLMTSDGEGEEEEEEEALGSDYRGGGGSSSSRGRGVGGYLASLTGGWPSPKESPPRRSYADGGGVGGGGKVSAAPATLFGGPRALTSAGLRLKSSAGDRVWLGGSASGSGRGKYYSAEERGRRVIGGSVSPGECVAFGGFLSLLWCREGVGEFCGHGLDFRKMSYCDNINMNNQGGVGRGRGEGNGFDPY